jgi:AsmA family protein
VLPLSLVAALVAAIGVAEWQGWRFLAHPAERWLTGHLERDIDFGDDAANGFRLSLLGRIRLQVAELNIANPSWSQLGPMVQARQAELKLRYHDLMAARSGAALTIQSLQADGLQLQLERKADGRASWQFGADPATPPGEGKPPIDGVHFESLIVRGGQLKLIDAPSAVQLEGQFAYLPDAWKNQPGWTAQAKGRYRDAPIVLQARTGAVLPGIDALSPSDVPLSFEGSAGRAKLKFDGNVRDLLGQQTLNGRYLLSGPSLAAVGEPLGVTLPTTAQFTMQGQLQREGTRWTTQVQSAHIGRSRLAGEFEFRNRPGELPSLTGELRGPVLWLQDLGPAIGAAPEPELAKSKPGPTDSDGRVLPDRPLDLPSLAMMKADVRIKLDQLELGHPKLQSLRPLKAHLTLNDSVLTLEDLDATLAQGRVWGRIQLDGRRPDNGVWTADLATSGLRLEQWIRQDRPKDQPPYVAGDLGGRFRLTGHGRSIADLLATADGQAQLLWTRGRMSHLVVEAAGIDIAQALGVMLRGDDALAVNCGAADLQVQKGQVLPRVLVVDTSDSTLWATGSLSLASERLDLTARVSPKDMSPLALRTPVHVRGTLGDPDLSLDKGPLARRVVPAVLLGMLNPLAALLPLIDTGGEEAKAKLAGCQQLVQRHQQAAQKMAQGAAHKPARKSEQKVAATRPADSP